MPTLKRKTEQFSSNSSPTIVTSGQQKSRKIMLENSIKPFPLLLVLLVVFLVLCRVPFRRQDNETDFTEKSSSQVRPPSASWHTLNGDHTHTFAGDRVRCQSALDSANSATGSVFSNERKRQYTGSRAAFSEIRLNFLIADQNSNCSKWGVVTTIFNPTIAIVRVALLPSWCMVIVPDLNTPTDYMDKLHALLPTNNEQQQHYAHEQYFGQQRFLLLSRNAEGMAIFQRTNRIVCQICSLGIFLTQKTWIFVRNCSWCSFNF